MKLILSLIAVAVLAAPTAFATPPHGGGGAPASHAASGGHTTGGYSGGTTTPRAAPRAAPAAPARERSPSTGYGSVGSTTYTKQPAAPKDYVTKAAPEKAATPKTSPSVRSGTVAAEAPKARAGTASTADKSVKTPAARNEQKTAGAAGTTGAKAGAQAQAAEGHAAVRGAHVQHAAEPRARQARPGLPELRREEVHGAGAAVLWHGRRRGRGVRRR